MHGLYDSRHMTGRFLGFRHSSGEKHILDDSSWVACPGQDNEDERCTTGEVGSIFEGDADDHSGAFSHFATFLRVLMLRQVLMTVSTWDVNDLLSTCVLTSRHAFMIIILLTRPSCCTFAIRQPRIGR